MKRTDAFPKRLQRAAPEPPPRYAPPRLRRGGKYAVKLHEMPVLKVCLIVGRDWPEELDEFTPATGPASSTRHETTKEPAMST